MDIDYLLFLQHIRQVTGGVFDEFIACITTYGEELVLMMIVAAIYWCVDKKQGVYTMLTWGTGRLVNGFLKITACVYRPWIRDPRIVPVKSAMDTATGYSFPSGHVTRATAVYGSLATNKKITRVLRVLLIMMIVLVAFSRNYLGVHTPQDVVVGALSTLVIVFSVRWILRKVEEKPGLDIWVLIIGLALNIAVIIYAANKSYPMDYNEAGKLIVKPAKMIKDTYKGCGFSMAVLIGWFVDRRWLKYEVQGSIMQRISAYVIGMLGYFLVIYVGMQFMPDGTLGAVLGRFIRVIYVMLIVPACISYGNRVRGS